MKRSHEKPGLFSTIFAIVKLALIVMLAYSCSQTDEHLKEKYHVAPTHQDSKASS